MKLTAELALSQVKRNKKRTTGTIFATVLATALLTAVMCLVTSGMEMLKIFTGSSHSDYRAAYNSILIIPAALLGLLIAFMSVTVISNIYESSANKRLSEFGVLKCVGATKKQIKETVIYESIWISIIAIPIGMIVGTFLGYISVLIAGRYVYRFNELSKNIVMRPVIFSLSFHISIWTYIFAAVFASVIVLISARKPAKNSGKITAIECIKGVSGNAIRNVAVKEKKSVEMLFGYEGILGYTNLKRNKTGYKSSVRALTLSIILILLTGSFVKQSDGIVSWMNSIGTDMVVTYASIADYKKVESTDKEETIIKKPIPYETAEIISKRLKAYKGGLNVLGRGYDSGTYKTVSDESVMTDELRAVKHVVDENGEMNTTVMVYDSQTYNKLCAEAGVPVGSNILINCYRYNDNGRINHIKPFKDSIKKVTLTDAYGETKELEIHGVINENVFVSDDLMKNAIPSIMQEPVYIIVPDGEFRFFDWYSKPHDYEDYTQYARKVLNDYYPILTEDPYVDQGYTVRISRADQIVKVMNIAIVLAEVLLIGLIILLIVMGFVSAISTLSTNIRLRKREFAVLKSVGMTTKSLEKMLYSESIICIIKSVFGGTIVGIILPWLINLSIRKVFPVRYELPIASLVIGLVIVSVLLIFITKVEIKGFRKQNIIEDIRMDVM
ncbi:MAG: ABC transporter permease [Eubacterium sp.]|nr:ABC transporter permease [Eubacterium sp.]